MTSSSQRFSMPSNNSLLLMKSFNRLPAEEKRFKTVSANVRDIGVRRAEVSQMFFMSLGLVGAIGSALSLRRYLAV